MASRLTTETAPNVLGAVSLRLRFILRSAPLQPQYSSQAIRIQFKNRAL